MIKIVRGSTPTHLFSLLPGKSEIDFTKVDNIEIRYSQDKKLIFMKDQVEIKGPSLISVELTEEETNLLCPDMYAFIRIVLYVGDNIIPSRNSMKAMVEDM